MKINKNDVLDGYAYSVDGPPDEWEYWCVEVLPTILASLVDIPSDRYSLWEMPTNPPGYPDTEELDKMLSHREESLVISNFLIWLQDNNMVLCHETEEEDNQRYRPTMVGMELLLNLFFGLDEKKIEKERQGVLNYVQEKYTDTAEPKCVMHVTAEGEEEDIEIS